MLDLIKYIYSFCKYMLVLNLMLETHFKKVGTSRQVVCAWMKREYMCVYCGCTVFITHSLE